MIFQMGKRKLTFPTPPSKRQYGDRYSGFWDDFSKGFFGTISDPGGTLVSLFKGQQPMWNRGSAWRNISTFDHRKGRKGFLGGLLSNFGLSYLKDALTGTIDAVGRRSNFINHPAIMQYKLLYKHPNLKRELMRNSRSMPHPDIYYDRRGNPLADMLYSFLQNQTVRDIGKKALVTGAGVLIPKALSYIGSKFNGKKKK